MIIELYMADFQILQTNHKLFILFYVFYAMCDICFALVTFLSARHIHVNSLQIARLGIHASSKIIKIYVVLWIFLAFTTISSATLAYLSY